MSLPITVCLFKVCDDDEEEAVPYENVFSGEKELEKVRAEFVDLTKMTAKFPVSFIWKTGESEVTITCATEHAERLKDLFEMLEYLAEEKAIQFEVNTDTFEFRLFKDGTYPND